MRLKLKSLVSDYLSGSPKLNFLSERPNVPGILYAVRFSFRNFVGALANLRFSRLASVGVMKLVYGTRTRLSVMFKNPKS